MSKFASIDIESGEVEYAYGPKTTGSAVATDIDNFELYSHRIKSYYETTVFE